MDDSINNDEIDFDFVESGLDALASEMISEDEKPQLINPSGVKKIQKAYDIIKNIYSGYKDIDVSYILHEPFKNMGTIYIKGKSIPFPEHHMFVDIARLVPNLDIYVQNDGIITVAFTSNDLTSIIDGGDGCD